MPFFIAVVAYGVSGVLCQFWAPQQKTDTGLLGRVQQRDWNVFCGRRD